LSLIFSFILTEAFCLTEDGEEKSSGTLLVMSRKLQNSLSFMCW